jgi:hypothetical protein
MANLLTRLTKLEGRKSSGQFDFKCLFIQVFDCSNDGSLKPVYGWGSERVAPVYRQHGESDADLQNRASAAAQLLGNAAEVLLSITEPPT